MESPVIEDLTAHADLTALVPLLYVAWADGALGEREILAIADQARERVSTESREALARWLDPKAPPSSTELLRLHRFVRDCVNRLGAGACGSLVELGCAIAALGDDEATSRGLREIEAALGIGGREAARHFFEDRPPVRQDFAEASPPFSREALTAILDGDHSTAWARVRRLVRDPRLALVHGLSMEQHREQVRTWLGILTDEGLGELAFAEGDAADHGRDSFVEIFEALGMHDLSLVVKLGVQFGLFGRAIANLGSPSHRARWIPAIARGELLGGFAMSELGHGSNVRDLETIARYDAERGVFVLHSPSPSARKEWIGNAASDGRAMVVFAQLETDGQSYGVHAFFVPIRDDEGEPLPGVSIEDCGHKMGLNGVDNGRLRFDHVLVPRENLLDRYGQVADDGTYHSPIASTSRRFFTMLGTLVAGRISVGAAAVTASKVALAIAVRYSALRRQFGPEGEPEQRILDYPAHHQRLMPSLAAAYAFHFAVGDLQRRWAAHQGEDMRDIEALAAGIKALGTWHAIDAIQSARECCGGMGFLTENRIGQIRRDVDVFATFEGDNTVLLQLVAKGLLGGFAKQLADDLVGTMLSEIAKRARRALLEQNPLAKRRTDDEHLLSADFHRDALRHRTHNLLVSAARRMKKRTDADMDAFVAATEIQDHLVALARAHVEEHVHACFAEAVEGLDEGPERTALEALRALYAVHRLRDDIGWFLENDYLDGRKARALRKLFGRQCQAVRRDAVALVDAFGIPDEMLGPIAFEQYTARAPSTTEPASPASG